MSGIDTATAKGGAHDPTITVENNIQALSAALEAARAADLALEPQREIEAAERAVEKAEANLAAAKDALKNTKAEVAARN